jgi:hypothetical protein
MPTAEGRGVAKKTWDAYARAAKPVLKPVADRLAAQMTPDLVGFWLVWQLEGGFEGLQRLGMSRASIYRRISLFRKIVGVHPDEFRFPGVTIDVATYLRGEGKSIGPRDTHPARKSQKRDN